MQCVHPAVVHCALALGASCRLSCERVGGWRKKHVREHAAKYQKQPTNGALAFFLLRRCLEVSSGCREKVNACLSLCLQLSTEPKKQKKKEKKGSKKRGPRLGTRVRPRPRHLPGIGSPTYRSMTRSWALGSAGWRLLCRLSEKPYQEPCEGVTLAFFLARPPLTRGLVQLVQPSCPTCPSSRVGRQPADVEASLPSAHPAAPPAWHRSFSRLPPCPSQGVACPAGRFVQSTVFHGIGDPGGSQAQGSQSDVELGQGTWTNYCKGVRGNPPLKGETCPTCPSSLFNLSKFRLE